MTRQVEEEEQWDDEGWDGDESNEQWDQDEPTIPCPYCRREIHEESQRCPYCGHYVSEDEATARRKPWWIIIGVLLCLLVIWLWIARGL